MADQTYISAPPGELFWRYSMPPNTGAKMILRTVGDIAVIGNWYGRHGQYFVAWCPLPANAPKGAA